jgi:hypothetical protein
MASRRRICERSEAISFPFRGIGLSMASSPNLRYDRSAAVVAAAKIPDRAWFAMKLPLCRRVVGLALVTLVGATPPALAADEDRAYTATVAVDATAESAAKARDVALLDGQRRALAAVVARLSGATETPQLAKLDDKAITDMVDNFEVANERMSAVRYLADYTFHFRPAKVRPYLRNADTAAADSAGKDAVVLPVLRDRAAPVLWDDPNPWRQAWAHAATAAGPLRLVVPLGDAGDIAKIDAPRAEAGNAEALTAIAQQNGAADAIVVVATVRRQDGRFAGVEVSTKRYRRGSLADSRSSSLDLGSGEAPSAFWQRAADAAAAEVETGAKKPGEDQAATLAAVVPIASLGEWVEAQKRLRAIAAIRKIDLLSLTLTEAKIQIRYTGTADELKSSLAAADFALAGADPAWRLERKNAANSR